MKRSMIVAQRKSNLALKPKKRPLLDVYGNTPAIRKRLIKAGRCIPHARKSCPKCART